MIAKVLIEITAKAVDKTFTYKIPDELLKDIKVGIRVEVPFGNRLLEGFVIKIEENDNEVTKLKSINSIVDNDVILNDELLWLGKKIQEKTLASLISCYQVMLPKALKAKQGSIINKKFKTFYKLHYDKNIKYNEKQIMIINLFENNELVSREDILKISSSSINTLLKKNILEEVKLEDYRLKYNNNKLEIPKLNNEQQKIIEKIDLLSNKIYLLHGITGSGKTIVYITLIKKVLELNKTALLLVPEISLTPQVVGEFERYFGTDIAVLHSSLSAGEKYDEYRRIKEDNVKIVIGARSASFAPLLNLGIIIIDEEHSDVYKQESNPRYNAKTVAKLRSCYHNIPVLLGSATPSLESYAKAKKNIYELLELPNRYNGKILPEVNIVDMTKGMKTSKYHFSKELIESIKNRIEKKEQIILLLNRRGYSPYIQCQDCGEVVKCINCDITLTYHKNSNILRCHYCGYATRKDLKCSFCNEEALVNLGYGTERIEEELNLLFPSLKVLRMDLDTTSKKGMHKKLINQFENNEYDLLLGTQMVAKGLDFSNVTLVGVINADTSLNFPDFKSSENTFSLLTQVAGRSGRSNKAGEVIIQTFNPEHYAIDYVKKHDYIGFYNEEIKIRKKLKYPPFYYICNVKINGNNINIVENEAMKIARALKRNLTSSIILGPSPATLIRVNNIFKYNIIIKYKKEDNLYSTLEKVIEYYVTKKEVKVEVDFN